MSNLVGMYGGEFNPLHLGHVNNIIKASSMCDELHIMICYRDDDTSVPKEIRYRWIHEITKHMKNVQIHLLKDEAENKDDYNNGSYWEQGRDNILNIIGKKIDVVYCGSDYIGTNRFEELYPDSMIYYFDRNEVPISSTNIRNFGIENWDYIPKCAKSYYAKKVLLLGGESTGKSMLCENLALCYNTNFVKEVGRDTCERAGGEEFMTSEDLYENIIRQKINVMDALEDANRLLFVDTESLTTKFYGQFLLSDDKEKMEKVNNLADSINDITNWDLVLFLEPDIPFVQDGTRNEEIENDREKFSNQIKQILDEKEIKYHTIGGNYFERLIAAKEIIKDELGITTAFNTTYTKEEANDETEENTILEAI